MPLTDEQIEELKAKNVGADLTLAENEEFGATFVLKTPGPAEYQGWRALQETSADLWAVNRDFALRGIVYPTPAETMALFKRAPGLVEVVVKQLVKLAGARVELTVKKL